MKTQIKQFALTVAATLVFATLTAESTRGEFKNTTANVESSTVRQTYNLTTDWSNTANPNGVWSYNQGASPITTFQTFWWGQAGWGYMEIGDGCIIKGSYFAGITDPWGNVVGPAHDWQPGDVVLHALSIPYGGGTTFVNVTWTSPADGIIDIKGRAWDAEIFPDRDVAWSLIVAGNTVAQRSSVRGISRKDRTAQFSGNRLPKQRLSGIPVAKGDVVEFRVATDTYYGHFVGVQAQISLTTKPQ